MLTGSLSPIQLPATLSGTLITNQMITVRSIVVNGTAPLDPLAQTKRLSKKKVENAMAGTSTGVRMINRFQESPPNDLYVLAAT